MSSEKTESLSSPVISRARSSSKFGSFRRKIFGGAEDGAAAPIVEGSPSLPKRSSVFGLSALARKAKEPQQAEEESVSAVQFESSSPDAQTSSGGAPAVAAVAPSSNAATSASGTPLLGRTRRSLSVANLRDRLTGKSAASNPDQRKSIDPSSSSDVIPSFPSKLEAGKPRSRAGSVEDVLPQSRVSTSVPACSPKVLSHPGEEREALINALSSCSANLSRALGSSSKASRLLGGARPRASSLQSSSETSIVLDMAVALGNAIATMTSQLHDSANAPGFVRETLGRYKSFEDALAPLAEKTEEWREASKRFGHRLLKLLMTLEAYVRDPESKISAVRVRTVLDELQGAGNYVKGYVSGVLTEPACEQSILAVVQSCFVLGNTSVAHLLRNSAASTDEKTMIARLAAAVSELRLSVVVLSPIVCARDVGDQLLAQTKECRTLVSVFPSSPTLIRLDRLLQDLECVVQICVSVTRMKMQSNTANIAILLELSEKVVSGLQTRSKADHGLKALAPTLSLLPAACEAVRGGLLQGAKISTAWAECHAHQKRILADAMMFERLARPFLAPDPDQPALVGVAREDAIDALLVAAIRLSASAKNFVLQYVAPSCSTSESFAAACQVVSLGASRHRHRALLASVLAVVGAVEARIKELPGAEAQRIAFVSLLAASDACHNFLLVLNDLEGGYIPSPWQQLGPEAQMEALPNMFNPVASSLKEAAASLIRVLSDPKHFPQELATEAWGAQLSNLTACLHNVQE